MEKMSVEQLQVLKEQASVEVNLLQDSLANVQNATTRFEIASTALHDLSLQPQGTEEDNGPVNGFSLCFRRLDDGDRMLVDIGTGYFVEKTMAEGKDYCERKIKLLKSNFDQLMEIASKKKKVEDEVEAMLQIKFNQSSATSP